MLLNGKWKTKSESKTHFPPVLAFHCQPAASDTTCAAHCQDVTAMPKNVLLRSPVWPIREAQRGEALPSRVDCKDAETLTSTEGTALR